MAQFPTDIVADILSRLPVEPILRFRCVSKSWCALIDSPHFVKLHLKRSIDTRNNRKLILSDRGLSSLYSVSMPSLDIAVKIDHHPVLKRTGKSEFASEVLGSCNGLVLIGRRDDLAIWNPSTRKYRILASNTDDHDIEITGAFYGIGYDSVHDDYKVLKITWFCPKGHVKFHSEIEVYSIQMDSWRKIITDFPLLLCNWGSCGVLASGALHYIARETISGKDFFIVAFDLATEEYRLLLMPCLNHQNLFNCYMKVASLEGSICILFEYFDDCVDMWVMKDYGVRESWTKLLTITEQICPRPFEFAAPRVLFMDGTKLLLLQESTNLIWYDLKNKVVETVNIRGPINIYHAEFYMPSLVPVGKDHTDN